MDKRIGNVSSKFVENIEVKIPLFDEHHKIVAILDKIMDKKQQAKEIVESVLNQIDIMKKEILARAFCGELDTNDPAEESAVEMLKEILWALFYVHGDLLERADCHVFVER